jgi:hypothetical protein
VSPPGQLSGQKCFTKTGRSLMRPLATTTPSRSTAGRTRPGNEVIGKSDIAQFDLFVSYCADCRIDNAIIHLHSSNRVSAHICPPTFGSQGCQATLPDDCVARVTG